MELIKINDYSKGNLQRVADSVISKVQSGDEYPLEAYIQAKALAAISDAIIKSIKDAATAQAEHYKSGDNLVSGVKVEVSNPSAMLDYSQDPEISRLEMLLKDRKEIVKKATDMAAKGLQTVDENGELVSPVPVKNYIGGGIKISFK
jgi:hypothetical protein